MATEWVFLAAGRNACGRHKLREADSRSSGTRRFHPPPSSILIFSPCGPLALPSEFHVIHMRATWPVRLITFLNSEQFSITNVSVSLLHQNKIPSFAFTKTFTQCQRPSFTPVESNRKTFILRVFTCTYKVPEIHLTIPASWRSTS